MKSKLVLLVAVPLVFGTLICRRVPAQQPELQYDYHLPGLDDESKARSKNLPLVAREPRVIEKGPLALTVQDRDEHTSFLAEPNTGLIRLLPRTNPKSAFAYAGERPALTGGGAYFSFHYRSHQYGYGSDLELQAVQEIHVRNAIQTEMPPHYILSVGFAGADFGMLANIGDVSLTDLTAFDSRAAYLLLYQTPRAESQARAEGQRFGLGTTIDGRTYKRTLPLEVNATYLLRSIVYDRSDVLVAFHVERQDKDGSVIVAWKLLKSFPMTQLARNN